MSATPSRSRKSGRVYTDPQGVAAAKVRGELEGRKPKLFPAREHLLVDLNRVGHHTINELMKLSGFGWATIH